LLWKPLLSRQERKIDRGTLQVVPLTPKETGTWERARKNVKSLRFIRVGHLFDLIRTYFPPYKEKYFNPEIVLKEHRQPP